MSNVNHAAIQTQIADLESLVDQIHSPEFDDDVVEMAREELEEVKTAGNAVLAVDEDLLPYVISSRQPVWSRYEKKYRSATSLLTCLL